MTPADRTELVCRLALEVGFDRAGVARAQPVARGDYLRDWLARGWAGQMHYLARQVDLRTDPRRLLDGARSVIVVADNYHQADDSAGANGPPPPRTDGPHRGRIAQYAWGRDYHRVVRKKLRRLVNALESSMAEPFGARVCVDTAPIMERELAAAAGIGWIGKNTMVLHERLGSFFFLGEIVTTLELTLSEAARSRCGSCRRCLEACPTGALIAPYQMDASRCIAYLTIECREEILEGLKPLMGDWVFGCDICQQVCPYNRSPPITKEPAYQRQRRNSLPPRPVLAELMTWTQEQYQRCLAGSAIRRATLKMLQRNAAIACQNAENRPKLCPPGKDARKRG